MKMTSTAVMSLCKKYRYVLTRFWDNTRPVLGWVMLNPSTADGSVDDPTVRKCVGFAKLHGYGGIVVVNLFAFRATDPEDLRTVVEELGEMAAIGPENDDRIVAAMKNVSTVICAWGNYGDRFDQRVREVRALLKKPKMPPRACLGTTNSGQPRHPLMVPYTTWLEPFKA